MKKELVEVATAEDRSLSYMARKFIQVGIERFKAEQIARAEWYAEYKSHDFEPNTLHGRDIIRDIAERLEDERVRREQEKGSK